MEPLTTSTQQSQKTLQLWNLNLSDENNDGIWIGEIDIVANEGGKAQVKVTAFDGETIDFISINIEFVGKRPITPRCSLSEVE